MLEIDDEAIERMIALSSNENATDQMIRDVIKSLNIKTTLTIDEMVTVFKLYHQNCSDSVVAVSLGDRKKMRNVERARIKLGLFRWRDFEMPFDINEFVRAMDTGKTDAEIAEMFGVGKSTVRTYRQLIDWHEAYGSPDIPVNAVLPKLPSSEH
ncbi:MAG TPA: hypothetical protein EYP67_03315, partial [Methanosarcinales archaeon]|nr:hypothetical protein [Methanosarcinales archaeon]